jgi:hypothetical protein
MVIFRAVTYKTGRLLAIRQELFTFASLSAGQPGLFWQMM